MRNIALAGGMGAGKSTVADYLANQYAYEKVKISEPIYEIAEKLRGPEAGKNRALLQDLGAKLCEIDSVVWINYYVRMVESAPAGVRIVNDTLRFRNEYWALKNADFVLVRVLAPEAVRVDRLQKIGRIQDLDRLHHVSETDLIGARAESEGVQFDYEIWNDTDEDAMKFNVDNMMRHLEEEA